MGADGGSIVGRQELVVMAAKPTTQHDPKLAKAARVNTCAISHQPLRPPIVMCGMGWMYNKEALIEYLLAKKSVPIFSHITGLKDVREVKLTWTNENGNGSEESKSASSNAAAASSSAASNGVTAGSGSAVTADHIALYRCPILSVPSNGVNRFIAMHPCGCVVSERAWKSVTAGKSSSAKQDEPQCLVCNQLVTPHTAASSSPSTPSSSSSSSDSSPSPSPFHHPSYSTLYPGPDESLYLRERLAEMLRVREAEKAAKKAAKKKAAAAHANGSANGTAATSQSNVAAAADGQVALLSSSSLPSTSHKRKAESQDVDTSSRTSASSTAAAASSTSATAAPAPAHSHKKPHTHTAPTSSSSSSTGNVLADRVRAITAAAAQRVQEKRKDQTFSKMFLTAEQLNQRPDQISTKPLSYMSQL